MPTPDDRSSYFTCPRCLAWLKASAALVGTRRRCPRCQLVFQVPPRTQTAPRIEAYPLSRQAGPLPADQPVYIPVVCSVCHTRMYATVDQVGQELVCPDCGTPAVVSPPAVPAKPTAVPIAAEVYPLHEEAPSVLDTGRAAEQSLIRVYCGRCGTMMYANVDQVGRKLVCPDCGTPAVVPPPSPLRKEIDVMADAGEGYRLAGRDETGPRETVPPPAPSPAGKPRSASYHLRLTLPRRPFLSGTFTFPFSRDARARVVLLTVWAIIIVGLTWESGQLGAVADLATWTGSAVLTALATTLAVMWFVFISACALAVVRDTANGCDDIQTWPGVIFIDWIGEPFYIFDSVCVSLLPGIGLAWLLAKYDQPGEAATAASLFLLFPIVLLSMLETNSPLGAISWPVCQTLWRARSGWGAFYLASAVLLAAAGSVAMASFSAGRLVGMIAAVLILTVVWFIYFRLLGRLAWYCADLARKRDEAG